MTSEKDNFIQNIQSWVNIDTQIKMIHEKTKPLRERKIELSEKITKYMKQNQIDKKRIDITDGSLGLYEKKEYSALTYGYIEKCLGEIIPDKKHVEYIITYLREHRQIKQSTDIRRYAMNGRPRSKSVNDSADDIKTEDI